jgi:UDP-N-acetylmuramoyl-tripeptide--D-alanyl-D-alanine ligase
MKQTAKKLITKRLTRKLRMLLDKHKLTVIAVTGTVGKTSTKVAIAQVLEAGGYKVGYTEDSYNSDIGLPLSVFGLKVPDRLGDVRSWRAIFRKIDAEIENFPYDTLVLEVAEDDLALMKPFVELTQPSIGVITSVSLTHTDRMGDLGRITHNLKQLTLSIPKLICNVDFSELESGFKPVATYATSKSADVSIASTSRAKSGKLTAQLNIFGEEHEVKTQLVGRHNLSALLAASAVAHQLGMDSVLIAKTLATIGPVKGRMNLLPGVHESILIDDTYNAASPVGVFAALDTLAEVKGRKIAVLGNMNELGAKSEDAHRAVGAAAAKIVDLLVVIGPDAEKYLAPAAIEAGMDRSHVKVFHTPYEAGHYLKKKIAKGDVVLVKGSQNRVFAEEVSRILLDPKLKPVDVLVRQSDFWKRKKKRAFAQ